MGPVNDKTATGHTCTRTSTHTDANKVIKLSMLNTLGMLLVVVADEDTQVDVANPARCSKTSCCTSQLTYERGCISIPVIAARTLGLRALYYQRIHVIHW